MRCACGRSGLSGSRQPRRLGRLAASLGATVLAACGHIGSACAQGANQSVTIWEVRELKVDGSPRPEITLETSIEDKKLLLRTGSRVQDDWSFRIPKGTSITVELQGRPLELVGDDGLFSISARSASLTGGRLSIVNWLRTPFPAAFHRYIARDVRTEYEVRIDRQAQADRPARESFCVNVLSGAVQILRLARPPQDVEEIALLVGPDLAARWPGRQREACYALDATSKLDHFDALGNAELAYRKAVDLARAKGDAPLIANAWIDLARYLHTLGRYDTVVAEYEAALRDERIVGIDRFWIVNNLGAAYLRAGDLAAALERHAQAKALAAALPAVRRAQAVASNAINTGNALLEADRIDDAIARYRDAHALLEYRSGPTWRDLLVKTRIGLAATYTEVAQYCEADAQLALAKPDAASSRGCASDAVLVDLNLAQLRIRQQRPDAAREALAAAQSAQQRLCPLSPHLRDADIAEGWGDLAASTRQFESAAEKYQQALDVRELLARDASVLLAGVQRKLADVALARSQPDEAARRLDEADASLAAPVPRAGDRPMLRADLLDTRAHLHLARGEPDAARRALDEADRLRRAVLGERPHPAMLGTLAAMESLARHQGDQTARDVYAGRAASMRSALAAARTCR